MAIYRVTDPTTGKSIKLTGDSPPTEQELNEIFASVSSKPKPLPFPNMAPINTLKALAPSNVLKQVGVASANAPAAFNLAFNALPGQNPAQILPSLQNVQQNPGQAGTALKRIIQVQGGGGLTEKERLPALAGQTAGTLVEIAGMPSFGTEAIKAKGPFMAGIKRPSTVLPGSFEKAGEALGKAKTEAGAGIDSPAVHNILKKLEVPKEAKKLLTEAREWVQRGMKFDISTAKMLAYKQVLGEAQAEGGAFADVYAQATKKLTEKIAERSPKLDAAIKEMALNFVAQGNPPSKFPWFTTALNPKVGLAKIATLPVTKNVAGAALSPLVQVPGSIGRVGTGAKEIAETIKAPTIPEPKPMKKKLTKDIAKEFLREAKGDRDKARELAKKEGYEIPKRMK